MYAILSLFFYFQFAVAMLTNIGFVRLSPFQMSLFQLCPLSEFTLTGLLWYPDEALSDYFMVDYMYVAHSKFNASNTPKE